MFFEFKLFGTVFNYVKLGCLFRSKCSSTHLMNTLKTFTVNLGSYTVTLSKQKFSCFHLVFRPPFPDAGMKISSLHK